jgi:ketopantoate hydroxymethyltransferase
MSTGSIRQGGGALEDIVSITLPGEPRQKITVASLREKKLQHQPITCLTAYDYASARLVDEANIDIVLVGDSLAMTMLGYPDTRSVTVDEMLHHTKCFTTRKPCGVA